MNEYLGYSLKLLLLTLLQWLVLDRLPLPPYGTIIIFYLGLLMFPIHIPTYQVLLITFFISYALDLLSLHPGYYTTLLLFIIAVRRLWVQVLTPQLSLEREQTFYIENQSVPWRTFYLGIPAILFEIGFVFLSYMEMDWQTLQILVGRIFLTLITLYLLYFVFYRKKP